MMCGGTTEVKEANEEIQEICDKVISFVDQCPTRDAGSCSRLSVSGLSFSCSSYCWSVAASFLSAAGQQQQRKRRFSGSVLAFDRFHVRAE